MPRGTLSIVRHGTHRILLYIVNVLYKFLQDVSLYILVYFHAQGMSSMSTLNDYDGIVNFEAWKRFPDTQDSSEHFQPLRCKSVMYLPEVGHVKSDYVTC